MTRSPRSCSKDLQRADWPEARIAHGDLSEQIWRLKREPGKNLIAYGDSTFDQALSRLGLVDEFRMRDAICFCTGTENCNGSDAV